MFTKKHVLAFILNIVICVGLLQGGSLVQAQSMISNGLTKTGVNAGIETNATIYDYTALIIRTVLGVMGIVVLILVIYAGVLYLGAAGNPERIKKATNILLSAALGLIVIFGAYSIANYVVQQLQQRVLKT